MTVGRASEIYLVLNMASRTTVCWICYKFASKGVVRHMAIIHAHDSNFFIRCGLNDCPRNYTNFYSFCIENIEIS